MRITIFTPTFNRAHTLPRVYKSLCNQKNYDFEWIVVDDGSTDNTKELIEKFSASSPFPIRYYFKENGGKHTAYNIGLQKAEGYFFVDLDSDDYLPDDFMSHLLSLESSMKSDENIASIISLKIDTEGKDLGVSLPCDSRLSLLKFEDKGKNGEYVLIFKTYIAKQYRFPVIPTEKYMPESVLYDMFERYVFVAYNFPMMICEYQPEGLSSIYPKLLKECPGGFLMYHCARLDLVTSIRALIYHAIHYNAFLYAYGNNMPIIRYEGKYRWLVKLLGFTRHIAARRIGVV